MRVHSLFSSDAGAQLAEFALTLPLLAVFLVGIFDFGNAFAVKQKISNAARDGARIGANLPSGVTTIFTSGSVVSADIVRDAVHASLLASRVNDCGLLSATRTTPGTLTWQYTASGSGCPAGSSFVLTVARGFSFSETVNGNTAQVLSTQVIISYPYQWRFGNVIKVLIPSSTYAGVTNITTTVTMPNLD